MDASSDQWKIARDLGAERIELYTSECLHWWCCRFSQSGLRFLTTRANTVHGPLTYAHISAYNSHPCGERQVLFFHSKWRSAKLRAFCGSVAYGSFTAFPSRK